MAFVTLRTSLRVGWRDGLWACLWAVALCATVALGVWQTQRAQAQAIAQAQRDQARAAPPRHLDRGIATLAPWDGRRVLLRGVFVPEGTIFLDNRTYRGRAGFYVLTPLRLLPVAREDSIRAGVVLVVRGWVPRAEDDRTRLPRVPTPEHPVEVQGMVLGHWAQPRLLQRHGVEADGRLWQGFDEARYRAWSGLPVLPGVVQQSTPIPDGLVRDWVEPGSRVDRHRAYALQWFAMTAALIVYALVALRRRWKGHVADD